MNCPKCNAEKSMNALDESNDMWICLKCGMTYERGGRPLVNVYSTEAADPRPPITEQKPPLSSIVCDFHTDENGETIFTSRVYLPKEKYEDTPFDPEDPHFKFALKVHRKRFKNRRRYMYERQRKMETAQ